MLKISPKLIDVEGNRVETTDDLQKLIHLDNNKDLITTLKGGVSNRRIEKISGVGRFPTQLSTNIKNDKYKYVKNIT